MSGLHSLSRPITLPQLPREMLVEAVKREAKRVLPVPLEQLYLSWQTIPAPEGKMRVFLVAVPRKTADALYRVLRRAGLKPSFMDLKPLLLAKVVKEATAIITDVQPTEFDIVIMADGVPQPVRTVSLPSEALSWPEKLPLIRDELDRTIKFYNSNNPDKPLAATVPVFVSGEMADEPELCQSLSGEIGHPVLPLPSPLECPEGLNPSRYMGNIILAFQKLSSGKEARPSVIGLNVLPAPYRPKPVSLSKVLALPGAAVALGLLIFLIMLTQSASADINSIRDQRDTTDQLLLQRLSQRQEMTKNIAELEKKNTEVAASRDNFIAAFNSLEQQTDGVNGDLKLIVASLPETISLSDISQNASIVALSGRTPSEKEILSYLRKLDASGRFSEITITSMRIIEGGRMEFTLLLSSGGRG